MATTSFHAFAAKFAHIRNGEPIWESDWIDNNLSDAGEYLLLDCAFRQGTAPTAVYGALVNDSVIDTDDLSTIVNEPSGNGYGRVTWNCNSTDFPTLALASGDYQLTSAQKTFTASGGSWSAVNTLCIVSAASGTTGSVYAYISLSGSRTLADGDSLVVTASLRLS